MANRKENQQYQEDTTEQTNIKKRKKKRHFGFLYLFVFVFIAALITVSHLVKQYSPDVDVAIGNREVTPLNYADSDYEIRTIDERLKWIQMEDDMPSVSVKKEKINDYSYLFDTDKKSSKDLKKKQTEQIIKKTPPKPTIDDIKTKLNVPLPLNENIASAVKQEAAVEPSVSITKVYIGKYSSLDEAIEMQHSVSNSGLGISPFVKSVNNHYIVQVGSFYDSKKADDLVSQLKAKGFSARKKIEK